MIAGSRAGRLVLWSGMGALIALMACSTSAESTPDTASNPAEIPESTIEPGAARIYLSEPSGDYQAGWADITEEASGLRIVISVEPAEPAAQPIHIHAGTCETVGEVVYSLENVVGGQSSTLLPDLELAAIAHGDMVINLHRSFSEFRVFTACGAIPVMPPGLS